MPHVVFIPFLYKLDKWGPPVSSLSAAAGSFILKVVVMRAVSILERKAFQFLSWKLTNSQLSIRNSKGNDLTYFLGCAPLQLLAGFLVCLAVFPPTIKKLQPAESTIFLVWLMSTWIHMNNRVCLCSFCVFLYLMTRWLRDTAEAGATHLSQRRPIAQRLIHRVDNAIICLYTQPDKVEQSNICAVL